MVLTEMSQMHTNAFDMLKHWFSQLMTSSFRNVRASQMTKINENTLCFN